MLHIQHMGRKVAAHFTVSVALGEPPNFLSNENHSKLPVGLEFVGIQRWQDRSLAEVVTEI